MPDVPDRTDMRTILFDYIDVFYDRSRHQVGLEDQTPGFETDVGRLGSLLRLGGDQAGEA